MIFPSAFRVTTGQRLELRTISSSAVALRAYARLIYDDGEESLLAVSEITTSASRVQESSFSPTFALRPGWVTFASVDVVTAGIKRGQVFVRLSMDPTGSILLEDYAYQNHSSSLGVYRESGPAGGDGYLETVTVKAEGAPDSDTFYTLALSNMIRKIHGYVWYYKASATAASRIMDVILHTPLRTTPTGFTVANSAPWEAAAVTLTASQEGTKYADGVRQGDNTNGSIATKNTNTDWAPFPYWADESDTAQLVFSLTAEQSNDLDVIYSRVESWLVM